MMHISDAVDCPNNAAFFGQGRERPQLAFYNQSRQAYWNPDKDTNILDGEPLQAWGAKALHRPRAAPNRSW
jgi:hypothetical protein